MADISFFDKQLLYGGDYNPDQWLDRPDILSEDIQLMKKAHISVVSLGIFGWSTFEPEEGLFQFDWMDQIIENLHKEGIKVFLATPTGARPVWMAEKYPEVLRVNSSGQRNLFGERHNHCFSSPVYREKAAIINRKLAQRYGKHPAVVLWHISNEYSGDCHCPLCQENFRSWLKGRYGSIDALNKAWWNTFWSHTMTDWQDIHSPVPYGETTVHGLNVDWKRFTSYMTVDFMRCEVEALREAGSDLPVTTNMMATVETPERDPGLDYWKFRDAQDIASWDSYPSWHSPGYKAFDVAPLKDEPVDDYRRASEVAFQHDFYRSLHQRPFLLMESTPSKVNWKGLSKNKRPGMNLLSSLHALAHGANSVQYFQWRQGRGSYEKFHGALIDQSGREDTQVFQEAARLGKALEQLKELASTGYPVQTALLFNWENRWALEDSKGPINGKRKAYIETIRKHYYSLWDEGVPMDVISGEEDLRSYDLIVAPMLYSLSRETAERLNNFVREGGTLVTTYLSGYTDEADLCYEGGAPGPLKEALGLRIEDLDALHPFEKIPSDLTRGGTVEDYVEIVHPESAEVLAALKGYPFQDFPHVTVHPYGKGRAYHLAGRTDLDSLKQFYRENLDPLILRTDRYLKEKTGKVNLQRRVSEGKEFLFLMNFSEEDARVELKEPFRDALDETKSSRDWKLSAYGITVLVRENPPRES